MVLIYNGEINKENLRKTKISMTELDEALREHGVSSTSEVNLAILELDGNISVLSNNFQTRSTQTQNHNGRHDKDGSKRKN